MRHMKPKILSASCHIWMRHGTWIHHVTHACVMSHMHESCRICMSHVLDEWVMSHLSHVTPEARITQSHIATHCNALQHNVPHCTTPVAQPTQPHTATQYTSKYYTAQQHKATQLEHCEHRYTPYHTWTQGTYCNTPRSRLAQPNCYHQNATSQSTATHHDTLQQNATQCNILQDTATHCNTLQHTAKHCNTLQHTATHCNTP